MPIYIDGNTIINLVWIEIEKKESYFSIPEFEEKKNVIKDFYKRAYTL